VCVISVVNRSGVNLTAIHWAVHLEMGFYIGVVDVQVGFDESSWDFSPEVVEDVTGYVVDSPIELVSLR
jgi:hypothetical protein